MYRKDIDSLWDVSGRLENVISALTVLLNAIADGYANKNEIQGTLYCISESIIGARDTLDETIDDIADNTVMSD